MKLSSGLQKVKQSEQMALKSYHPALHHPLNTPDNVQWMFKSLKASAGRIEQRDIW